MELERVDELDPVDDPPAVELPVDVLDRPDDERLEDERPDDRPDERLEDELPVEPVAPLERPVELLERPVVEEPPALLVDRDDEPVLPAEVPEDSSSIPDGAHVSGSGRPSRRLFT